MVTVVVVELLGAVVEREEERLVVSAAADEVEVVVAAVVEEALVVACVVVPAVEDEVVCLSSALLLLSFWFDSDCVLSLLFVSSLGSLSSFWVGFLMTRGFSTMRFTRLSTLGFFMTRRMVAVLPGRRDPSPPPPPPSSLPLLPSSPLSPRVPPFSRLLWLLSLPELPPTLAPLLAVNLWYFFNILFLLMGRALRRALYPPSLFFGSPRRVLLLTVDLSLDLATRLVTGRDLLGEPSRFPPSDLRDSIHSRRSG